MMRFILIIAFLLTGLAQTAHTKDWRPPPQDVRQLCQQITDPIQRADLFVKYGMFNDLSDSEIRTLDINHDGVLNKVDLKIWGTARMTEIHIDGTFEKWALPEINSEILRWNRGINVLHIGPHNFILAAKHWGFRKPTALYIVAPDNRIQLLCTFSHENDIVLTSSPERNPLCHAMLSHSKTFRAEYTKLTKEEAEALGYGVRSWHPQARSISKQDVFNTGEPTDLLSMTFDSSAGAGCSVYYYDLLEKGGPLETNKRRQVLLEAQGVNLEDETFTPGCNGSHGGRTIFEFEGTTYIAHYPANKWQIYINRISGQKAYDNWHVSNECSFVNNPVVSVEAFYLDWLK